MTTSTLTDLITPRSQQQILDEMFATAEFLGVDLVGVQAERMFRALFEIESRAKAREDFLRAQVAMAGFLALVKSANTNQNGSYIAPPNWTDALAEGFFHLFRYPAVATVGNAQLVCSALALGGTIPAMQATFSTAGGGGGVLFKNKYPFTIVPGTTVPVTLVATIAGTGGNVPVNSITQNVTVLGGCSINNPPGNQGSWITTAGTAYEADDNLIARCLSRWAASSYGGARSAYVQWVNDAFAQFGVTPTITRIGIDDTNPNGPGSTDIYLANLIGPATVQEVAIVDGFLQSVRGLGTGPLRVLPAPGVTIPIVATIQGNSGGVPIGTANLIALEGNIKIGGTVFRAALDAALMAVPNAYNVIFTTPLADIVLTGFQVPTFALSLTATN